MDLTDIVRALADHFTSEYRVLRLRFLAAGLQELDALLHPQSLNITERLNDGVTGHVTCLSTSDSLLLEQLRGVPVEVQHVTDLGDVRTVRGLDDTVRRGSSSLGLTVYQLQIVDPLKFLVDRQRDTYLSLNTNVVGMTNELLDVLLRQDCPNLGTVLKVKWLLKREDAYPVRAMWLQNSECVTVFLQREWRRAGISWVFRSKPGTDEIELLLFDTPDALEECVLGGVDFNRADLPTQRGTVIGWCEAHRLRAGTEARSSWDFRAARLDVAESTTREPLDGSWSSTLLTSIRNARVERPHDGDSWGDFQRLADLRIERAQFESKCFTGVSTQCELAVGSYVQLRGLPAQPPVGLYTLVDIRHVAHSNVQGLSELVDRLLAESERLDGWMPPPDLEGFHGNGEHAYMNAFTAVFHGTPLAPAWDPDIHQPPAKSLVGVIAGAEGSVVDVDNEGRFLVIIQGERTGRMTPRMRAAMVYAGDREALWLPLRWGMEVRLRPDGGDPNRLFIAEVLTNRANPPPVFDDSGSTVSGNAAQSGLHVREFNGSGHGEVMFDSTSGQISVNIGSSYARSRGQFGDLRGKRVNGDAPPIGEGVYLHTLASLALRAAKVLLLSTFGRDDASAWQLDMAEHVAAINAANELADALAQYAAENQGKPMDVAARAQLADYVAKATAGSVVDPDGGPGGQPTLNVASMAGIAVTTLQSILLFAQTNLDFTAAKHLQLTAGENLVMNARKALGMFAGEGGLSAIANQGDLVLQSQHGNTRIEADGDLDISATGMVTINGKGVRIRNADGTYLTLEGASPELGGSGTANILAAGHNWAGPSTNPAVLPSFGTPKPPDACIECLLNAAAAGSPVAMI